MKMPATTKKAMTGTPNSADSTDLTIVTQNNEPRVDSRLLAKQLGNQHRPTMALIDKHCERLETLGKVIFQKAPSSDSRTGQRERFAILPD